MWVERWVLLIYLKGYLRLFQFEFLSRADGVACVLARTLWRAKILFGRPLQVSIVCKCHLCESVIIVQVSIMCK